ncbi:MAG: response regulator [Zoogloea sp.]|nr:response regulator [Zoogloea sp.]
MNDRIMARAIAICGLTIVMLGLVVLSGWALGIRFLLVIVPGWSAMQPLTALAFMCSGLALLLAHGDARVRTALVLCVGLVAGSALWQYASGQSLGVDALLFPGEVLGQADYLHPGRMAQMTAVEFLLVACCFLLPRRWAWQRRAVSKLGSLGLTLAMVSLAGYAFGADGLPAMLGYSMMAAHTAAGFLVLFSGLKLWLSSDGWIRLLLSATSGGEVARRLLPLVLVWPFGAGMAVNLLDGSGVADPRLIVATLLVTVIVGQVWVIVRFAERLNRAEDARLAAEEGMHLRNRRLRLLADAAQELLASEDPGRVVQSLCERVMAQVECQVFLNYVVEKGEPVMFLNAYAGIPAEAAREIRSLHAGSSICNCAARNSCRIVETDVAGAPETQAQWMSSFGIQAYVCYALVYQGRSIGTLSFGSRTRQSFSEEDLDLMKTVSDLVATAMLRKQAKEALCDSNAELARALRLGRMGNWQLDAASGEFSFSDEACRLFGLQQRKVLDYQNFLAMVHPEDRKYVNERWQAALHGEPYDIEHRIVVGREVKWIREQAELEFDAGGRLVGGHGTSRDITDRMFARLALEAARVEAERANSAKTRFLAAASHDLRQPVQALRLLLGVLANRLDQPDASRELVSRMGEALGSTETMLARLMEFAALESGKVLVQREVFALDDLVRRVAGEHAGEAAAKGLFLRVRCFACCCRSDPVQLERVVRNLVVNAIRYTMKGGILLGLRRRGGQIVIEVRDTGIGISEDKRELIFEEFRQIDNAARGRGKGMGLGLAIVARTARILGHPLTLASTEGRGSLFAVAVPQVPCPEASADIAGKGKAESAPGRARILVVEDDPAQAIGLEMILADRGLDVRVAHEAATALAALHEEKLPDLVLTDYRFPGGVSGVDLVRQVRDAAGWAIPAILVTGDTQADIAAAARAAGCQVLHKPYTPDALLGLLDAALARGATA